MYTNWSYKFYVGQAAPSAVAAALVEFGIHNATITLAKGLYKDVAELTTVVEIIALVDQDAVPLARFLRDKFSQNSVLITKTETHHLMVEGS